MGAPVPVGGELLQDIECMYKTEEEEKKERGEGRERKQSE
jgi:hypothetical protein